MLEARYPGCTIASLGSDHYVGKPEEFCRLLRVAEAALEDHPDYLFTLGVKPVRVETGYGHILKGDILWTVAGEPVYAVGQFTEKPDEERARAYIDSGRYLWNSNMFVWKAGAMLELFARFQPEMHRILERIKAAVGTAGEAAVIADEYPGLPEVAVDNAIIERAERVATLEADIDWGDIGTWAALTDVLPTDGEGNLLTGEVLALDAGRVTAYGGAGKLLALVGVEDLVVVDTEDALLICKKDEAQRVKEVLKRLRGEDKYRKYI